MSTVLCNINGAVATVTLNRPEKLNALNLELLTELLRTIESLESNTAVRACVLTGAGEKAFAAGADIAAMSELTSAQAKTFADFGHKVGYAMENSRMPYIAAVNGFALGGGCEIALACDFIYASTKAKFGQPEVNLGVIPGFGGTQRLARRVGIARARELCMTADIISAEEAFRIGLANQIFAPEELLAKATKTATTISEKGPLAVRLAKSALLRGADTPLSIANEVETLSFANLFGSHDQREGMKAFLEKRAAKFEGR